MRKLLTLEQKSKMEIPQRLKNRLAELSTLRNEKIQEIENLNTQINDIVCAYVDGLGLSENANVFFDPNFEFITINENDNSATNQ